MMGHEDLKCCSSMFFLFLVAIVGLVAFAGLMAGLTLGLMSLGLVDLEVLSKSGRTQDRIHACPYNLFPFFFNLVFYMLHMSWMSENFMGFWGLYGSLFYLARNSWP